jgi:hypothetical protein
MPRSAESKKKHRDPIPEQFASFDEAAEFWDTHSVADYWDQTREVKDVTINLVRRHFRVEAELAQKIDQIARRRGVSAETLVNLWLREKAS